MLQSMRVRGPHPIPPAGVPLCLCLYGVGKFHARCGQIFRFKDMLGARRRACKEFRQSWIHTATVIYGIVIEDESPIIVIERDPNRLTEACRRL
jgi:hypothetical protein